jgi:hypothetical protein
MLEGDRGALPAGRRQVLGVRGVGDLGRHVAQADHLLHVDESLADLAVLETQHAERRVEVPEQGDGGVEAAHGHLAAHHPDAGGHGHHRQADLHDQGLGAVQHVQRGVGRHAGVDVVAHRRVIGPAGAGLGPEGLDGLVVDQGVDREAGGAIVGLVQPAAMAQPPVGDPEGDDRVEHDGHQRDRREGPAELGGHHPQGQDQFHQRRADAEDHAADQEVGGARAAVDDPRKRAHLLGLVEVERQVEHVLEALHRRPRHGRLRHPVEDRVAHIGGPGRGQAERRGAHRGDHEEGQRRFAGLGRQVVDRIAHQDRRDHARQLSHEDQGERAGDPHPQERRAGPQHQAAEIGHRAPEAEFHLRRRDLAPKAGRHSRVVEGQAFVSQ